MTAEELVFFSLTLPHTYLARVLWIRLNSVGSVLDVACGEGFVYSLDFKITFPSFTIHVPKVDTIALDLKNYNIYRRPGKPDVPKLENFIRGDAQTLPFKDKSFDTVTLSEVLEHPLNPIQVLREAKRVSRKRILVTVPDETSWIKRKVFRHFNIIDSIEHVRLFNAEKLKNYFNKAGLPSYKIHHILLGNMEYYTAVVDITK